MNPSPLLPLELERLGDEAGEIELADFFYPRETCWALQARADGSCTFVHAVARQDPPCTRWSVRQFTLRAGADRSPTGRPQASFTIEKALDTTVFEASREEFVERERYRDSSGTNLHLSPIVLPARLRPGVEHRPFQGSTASVALGYVGKVLLKLGAQSEAVRAACLLAREGDEEREQWMVQGMGEVALGSCGTFQRWLLGWSSESRRQLFGGAGPALAPETFPALPSGTQETARRSLL